MLHYIIINQISFSAYIPSEHTCLSDIEQFSLNHEPDMPPSSGRVFRLAQRQLMLMQLLISMSSSCLAAYSCQLPPSQMPLCALPLVGPATCLPGGDYTRTYFYTFRFLPFGIFITVSLRCCCRCRSTCCCCCFLYFSHFWRPTFCRTLFPLFSS